MDTTSLVLTVSSIVTGRICLLVALWLRLRWRTRHEQVRRQHLASVTQVIAEGGRAEVVEQRPDGHSLLIRIVRIPADKDTA
ncbi:hypothetical protein ACFYXF_48140 [Streptomyces sp. NPDC002680]|uniref:hypothetical protein n=1 Tax=Streptomyces sp. NPDC002680 TaxID=3364659 RepID=UPI0036BAC422